MQPQNLNVTIQSTDPSHPIGRLVQDYANKHYNTGFYHGFLVGTIVVAVIVGVTKRRF